MIKTETVKIKKEADNLHIEAVLNDMGIFPVRWAIVDCDEDFLYISVSFATVN